MSQTLKAASNKACLLDKLLRRSLIEGIYPESEIYRNKLKCKLNKPTTIYAGFDATSSCLHVGNLVTIMNLLHFRRHGHRVVCLIGDATTQIGDPSGHTKDRKHIDRDIIDENANSLHETLKRLFRNSLTCFDQPSGELLKVSQPESKIDLPEPVIVRNSEWYQGVQVVDFVSKIFRQVRVGPLLHKKSISERLQSHEGINMSEFSYQIFQAYDWHVLRKRYDCQLQIGGSDQAGNIYTGHAFIKKQDESHDAIGLLTPLILTESGKKLGKSSSDQKNIWLKSSLTSPYQLYQYFVRTPDKDVERFLKIFSHFGEPKIEQLIQTNLKKKSDVWYCQKRLASHVCALVHGLEGLESANRITNAFFNKDPLEIANLSDDEMDELFESNSMIKLLHQEDMTVRDLLHRAGCFKNDIEAEQVIAAGGLWINGAQVSSFNVPVTTDLIIGNDVTVMRVGKKNYFLFKWSR